MINVILFCFPYSTTFSVIYLTCPILPAVPFTSLLYITDIESSITTFGVFFASVASIFSKLFSVRRPILLHATQSLFALPEIWESVSSQEIYTISSDIHHPSCRDNVDFPIPGSPESRTILPCTNHPHNTVLNSPDFVSIFTPSFSLFISEIFPSVWAVPLTHFAHLDFDSLNSLSVFQALQ